MCHHNETSDEEHYDDAHVRSHPHLQIKGISSVWPRGGRCPIFKFLGFLVMARTVDTERLQNHPRAGRLHRDGPKLSRTRVSEQQCCMEMAPNSRAHALRSNSIAGDCQNPRGHACRSNSVVCRWLPLAHTRFRATVLHGDCSNPHGHACRSNSVVWRWLQTLAHLDLVASVSLLGATTGLSVFRSPPWPCRAGRWISRDRNPEAVHCVRHMLRILAIAGADGDTRLLPAR